MPARTGPRPHGAASRLAAREIRPRATSARCLLVKDRRKVHQVRILASQDPIEHGMALHFAGDTDSARFAVKVWRVDSVLGVPIPTLPTGRLNTRIGFVRRFFALRFGFDRRIGLLEGFRG